MPTALFSAILVASAGASAGVSPGPTLCAAVIDSGVTEAAFAALLEGANLSQTCAVSSSGGRLTVADAVGLGVVSVIALPVGLKLLAGRNRGGSNEKWGLVEVGMRAHRPDRVRALLDAGAPAPDWLLLWAASAGHRDLAAVASARGQRLGSGMLFSFGPGVDPGEAASALVDVGVDLPCEMSPWIRWTPEYGAALERAGLAAACQLSAAATLPPSELDGLLERARKERRKPNPLVVDVLHRRAVADGDLERSRWVGDRWGGLCRPHAIIDALEMGDLAFAEALLHRWGLESGCDGYEDPVAKVREAAVFAGPAGLALLDQHGLAPRDPTSLFTPGLVDRRLGPWKHPRPFHLGDPLETLLKFPDLGPDDDDRIRWLGMAATTAEQRATLLRLRPPSEGAVVQLILRNPKRALMLFEAGVPATPAMAEAAVERERAEVLRAVVAAGARVDASTWHSWTCAWPDPEVWLASGAPLSDAPCATDGWSELLVAAVDDPPSLRELGARGLDLSGPPGAAAMDHVASEMLAERSLGRSSLPGFRLDTLLGAYEVGLAASPKLAEALASSCRADSLAGFPSDALTPTEWSAVGAISSEMSWSCGRAVRKAIKAAQANPPRGR